MERIRRWRKFCWVCERRRLDEFYDGRAEPISGKHCVKKVTGSSLYFQISMLQFESVLEGKRLFFFYWVSSNGAASRTLTFLFLFSFAKVLVFFNNSLFFSFFDTQCI